ncbi:hypothetical protein CDO73_21275 [Saccharibacillus sp. O23]|uniref:helix-turn-helix domain-containing protein n=1 Tax=Saccharibacillus sp. O23 TaxID=2009338 RepID=UPI000B4E3B52|nr:helix-turn-helix domain-containing protein [Saccharibacillus sp. O23]OWR27725.1 hypothetical protein CDO73_21275 [Saccharibacillus sp. O23]
MFDMTKIGLNIARLRKESGMTQMELADRLGISYQAVSSWERGTTMPDISKLPLLADSFGVSIDEILNGGRGSELVRKIVAGPVEETLKEGEVSVEEFQELAPLLPAKQADAVFGRTEQPVSLSELVALAPFVSEKVLGECALKAFGQVDLSELVSLAPFLEEAAVDELALRGYSDSGVSGMTALAPFMSRKGLDTIVARLSGGSASPAELMSLAPFMSRENLNSLALRTEGEPLSTGELMSLAPFLDSDVVGRLASRALENSDLKGLAALAPFMDGGRLDSLARSMVAGRKTPPAAPEPAAEPQEHPASEAAAEVPSAAEERDGFAAPAAPPARPATPFAPVAPSPSAPVAPPYADEDRAPDAERFGEPAAPRGDGHSSFADPRR